ncbi:hypothetical protein LSTR_LSTR000267 [Laodelphax striatellus]|uniref:Uncharacterized protein n=1 Tax=Laodelphax striatellus TaxID=195883 RepID=A0A482X765_LAOST|nr:hypothetical protein LSTR_LSTR000267 [Laodelphax striatellus]
MRQSWLEISTLTRIATGPGSETQLKRAQHGTPLVQRFPARIATDLACAPPRLLKRNCTSYFIGEDNHRLAIKIILIFLFSAVRTIGKPVVRTVGSALSLAPEDTTLPQPDPCSEQSK